MSRIFTLSSVLVLAAFGLAGCNDEEDGVSGDRFGSTFVQAFNADANDTPINPEPGDAGRLSLTDEPIDF